MEPTDIYVGIRDANLNMVGKIKTELLDIKASTVHCGVGQWTVRLPRESDMAAALQVKGSGIFVQNKTKAGWVTLFSGPTTSPAYTRTTEDPDGLVTIIGVDDNVLLWDTLAWGDPNHSLGSQATATDVRSGPAESIMKQYVNMNLGAGALIARRGALAQKVTIATDTAAGATVKKSPRFQVLGELLAEIATYADMGFRIVQVGTNLQFQTYSIRDRRPYIRFSVKNGNLSEETTAIQVPTVTRTIVAGKGEGTARNLIQRTTADSLAAETDWGRKIEQWIDQRNTDDATELNQAGDEPLIAGGFTAVAVKAVPNESLNVKFGDDWKLGDKVKVVINNSESDSLVLETALVANSDGVDIGAALGDVTNFKAASSLQSQLQGTIMRVSELEKADQGISSVDMAAADLATLNSAKAYADGLVEASNIGAGIDLNSLTSRGYYYQGTGANATLALNYPEDNAGGFLEVYISSTASFVNQRYTTRANRVYSRTFFGSWTTWALVSSVDSGPISSPTGIFTVTSDWTFNSGLFRTYGKFFSMGLDLNYTGSTVTVPANGNITNVTIGTFATGYRPAFSMPVGMTATGGIATLSVNSSGILTINAVAPGSTFASGMNITVAGMWLTA